MLTLSNWRQPARWLCFFLTWHRSRSTFGLPVILIGGIVFAHVAFWFAGI
jgi:SulP family sulfate permease